MHWINQLREGPRGASAEIVFFFSSSSSSFFFFCYSYSYFIFFPLNYIIYSILFYFFDLIQTHLEK